MGDKIEKKRGQKKGERVLRVKRKYVVKWGNNMKVEGKRIRKAYKLLEKNQGTRGGKGTDPQLTVHGGGAHW